jgi:MFS family permease
VFAGLLFSWGVVGDRIGRRTVLLIGLSVFALGSVLAAFSDRPLELVGWRAVMGIGGAAVQPTTLAVITNVFPPGERGRAIGMWAGTAGLAVAGGPLAGGAVLEHFRWAPCSSSACRSPCWASSPSSRSSPSRGIRPPADLTCPACWCRCSAAWPCSPCSSGCSAGRRTRPFDVSLFGNPAFSAAPAALGLNFFALLSATFYLVYYLQGARDYSPLQSGAAQLRGWPNASARRPSARPASG